ncbi:pdf receptor-like protein-related [Holotrichia oblita]|uniref:Pdf receptor-like protein-related n=1 Tax=Holotrichia oblita TaxID=644536 RepID=A0ACB9T6M8_HOLOL|nr:pdf receptor-like protein-related [Holotrichia oblita]
MMSVEDKCPTGQNISVPTTLLESFCESIFDGYLCWPATNAGSLATLPCPFYNLEKTASKFCESTGRWFVSNETGRVWTNYTQCWPQYDSGNFLIEFEPNKNVTTNNYAWLPIMKGISHVGYWCSLLTLLAAMSIFLFIKRLQCARNILHMHLFASFILRIIMYLVKEFLFVDGIALPTDIVYIHGKGNYVKEHHVSMN